METQTREARVRRRRRRQGGQEILEFGIMAILFVPIMMGMFDTGMNLVKSLQANQIARDLGSIYIHGGDFSSFSMQQLAQRLANGMNLQFPAFGAGVTNVQKNVGAAGAGIVWVTQIEYIGPTSGAQCQALLPATCTNHDSFVYTQQVIFGSSTVAASNPNVLLDATANGATVNSGGIVQNPVTDATAKLPAAAQTAMTNLWQTSANGRAPLTDGIVVYVVECYFQTTGTTLGNFSSSGVYARSFF
jgi:hypothetical protein